jgi:inward rectifier potassium channel
MHHLTEQSPLHGVEWADPACPVVAVIVTMMGHDATYGQQTHARHVYYPEDVLRNHRFVDVVSELEDGRLMIDYTRFHDTTAEATRAASEADPG